LNKKISKFSKETKNKNTFYNNTNKIYYENLIFIIKPNNLNHADIKIIIKKKHIPLANKRNYLKRIIKESFRLSKNSLNNLNITIISIKNNNLKNINFNCLMQQWLRIKNL